MKVLKIMAISLVAVVAFAALAMTVGKQPQAFAEKSRSAELLMPGGFEVGSFESLLVDSTRTTQANKEYRGDENRSFDVTVWFPSEEDGNVAAGRHPLIVYSHGFSSMKDGGEYIAEHLASYGYVVIATSYPLTNFNAPGGPMVKDVVNQPDDVSFLIDSVLAWDSEPGHLLASKIDALRIGVTGISLGGMTTTLAAFHPEKRDSRIKAAASIAGPSSMFGAAFYDHIDMPFMMLATDQDALVDYQENAIPVIERVKGAHLVTIIGASHTGFASPARYLRWLNNPDSIGCDQVLKNIDEDEEPWYELIGTQEQGVIYEPLAPLCSKMPLPEAMNPLRQHMLTKVAILSFFQSQFAEADSQREGYHRYLTLDMAAENSEVSYRSATL